MTIQSNATFKRSGMAFRKSERDVKSPQKSKSSLKKRISAIDNKNLELKRVQSYEQSDILNSYNDPVNITEEVASRYELPPEVEVISPRLPMLIKTVSEINFAGRREKLEPKEMLERVRESR